MPALTRDSVLEVLCLCDCSGGTVEAEQWIKVGDVLTGGLPDGVRFDAALTLLEAGVQVLAAEGEALRARVAALEGRAE